MAQDADRARRPTPTRRPSPTTISPRSSSPASARRWQTSQEIKKEADTVVDSITASDIGAFPDKSVAEALQRMSGVTVTRFAASGDTTHFSAEPSGVVIRGLPQVRSEFNGRDSFNANSSRGLSFGDVSPELMAGVDTYKNATADMIEGGIAGTVNLRTHVPFDSEGFVAAFSAELGYGDLAEEAKPAGSFLISNRWDTGIGEFGLMANAAYSEVITESQGVQLLRFFNATNVAAYGGGTKWIPGGIDLRKNTYDAHAQGRVARRAVAQPRRVAARDVAVQPLRVREQLGRVFTHRRRRQFADSAGPGPRRLAVLGIPPRHAGVRVRQPRRVRARRHQRRRSNGWAGSEQQPVLAHPNGYPTSRVPERSADAELVSATRGRDDARASARARAVPASAPIRAPRRRPTSPKTCR